MERCPDCPDAILTRDMEACPECGRKLLWEGSSLADKGCRRAKRQREDRAEAEKRLSRGRLSELTTWLLLQANDSSVLYGKIGYPLGYEQEIHDYEQVLGAERIQALVVEKLAGDNPPAGMGLIKWLVARLKYEPIPTAAKPKPEPRQLWFQVDETHWAPILPDGEVDYDRQVTEPPHD
jgi:hypothetical protein